MLYIKTWPVSKSLKTSGATIIKIDKDHPLYPTDMLMEDLDMRLNNPNDSRIPSNQRLGPDVNIDIQTNFVYGYWRDKAIRQMCDGENKKLLDECTEQVKAGRDVIIAVCENRPYHRSWRRVLCEYMACHQENWYQTKFAVQIDDWPINTIISRNGNKVPPCYGHIVSPLVTREEVAASLNTFRWPIPERK